MFGSFRFTLSLYKTNVLLKVGYILLIKYIFLKICSVSILLFKLQKYDLLLHFFHVLFKLHVFQYNCGIQVQEYLLLLQGRRMALLIQFI